MAKKKINLLPSFVFLCCKIHIPSCTFVQPAFALALGSSGCDFAHLRIPHRRGILMRGPY